MRLLTVLAVAALAAGVSHYRRQRRRAQDERRERSNRLLPEPVHPNTAGKMDEPVGVLGPMQSGIATGP